MSAKSRMLHITDEEMRRIAESCGWSIGVPQDGSSEGYRIELRDDGGNVLVQAQYERKRRKRFAEFFHERLWDWLLAAAHAGGSAEIKAISRMCIRTLMSVEEFAERCSESA